MRMLFERLVVSVGRSSQRGHVMMEALLVLLPRKVEGQPHTYVYRKSPLTSSQVRHLPPSFSSTGTVQLNHILATSGRNAAYSQQVQQMKLGSTGMVQEIRHSVRP